MFDTCNAQLCATFVVRTYLHHHIYKLFIVLATVLHGFNAGVQGGGEIGHQHTVPLNHDFRTQAAVESSSCQTIVQSLQHARVDHVTMCVGHVAVCVWVM